MKMLWTIILAVCFQMASASTYTICSNCEYSIDKAYEASTNGDTLLIKSGKYEIENWVIDKKLTVIGIDRPELISKTGDEIITITKSDVTIRGLVLSGVITNYLKENAAIRIRKSHRFEITDNIINNSFFAIYLENVKKGIIQGNVITGNATTEAESGNGIHAWYCDSIKILNNTISLHRDGIYLEFVNNSIMNDNHSHHNTRYGLHYMFSNDDTYTSNIIEYNGVGVAVMFSRRITMTHNTFAFNWGHAAYGLLLKEIYDAKITDNIFDQNTVGIFIEGSNRIDYLRNVFRRNGWGIKFSGGCESNRISDNEFLHNSISLVVSSQLNNNTFDHNYWSEYTGYDLDKDQIGDVPHYPVKLYSYIQNQVPEAVVLMRSLFVDIINFAEKISPVFTPKDVMDKSPKMSRSL